MNTVSAASAPGLLASYWTLAGNVLPLAGNMASPIDLRQRVEAAGRAGYVGIGLYVDDVVQAVDRYGHAGIRQMLADNGITHLEFEALMDWFADGERRRDSDRIRRYLLDTAQHTDAYQLKVVGDMFGGDWAPQAMSRDFRELCRQAADVGVQVAIEVMPNSNIRDLPGALEIVAEAGCANGGLLFDIWHFARGGIAYEDIAGVPAEFIKHIELDDADRELIGTLFEDQILRRKLPGEGDLDVARFLRCVRASGYQGLYGVEIVSDAQRALPLEDAARLSFEATRAQFARIAA